MPDSLITQLYRRNRLLTAIGFLHLGLFLATVVLLLIDTRQVLGINTWIKPMKFMASLTIYLWTIAWFSEYIRRPRWAIGIISLIIAVVIVLESSFILLQAARATTSHFNIATTFDAGIFTAMGVMIGIDMVMTVLIFLLFIKPGTILPPVYLWSIRIGLVIFLIGGSIGGVMITNHAHTVGAADGGPGLWLFNWSTTAGDLRIAHGLALHALQIIPLAGFLIARSQRLGTTAVKVVWLAVIVIIYAGAVFGTFAQAMAGKPLF